MPERDGSRDLHLAEALRAYVGRVSAAAGTLAKRPGHRLAFHWPPHAVSYDYHLQARDWREAASFEAYGERFEVVVARTEKYGVFGRCDTIWLEARGETLDEMLASMRALAEPLFLRQLAIQRTLERPGRFSGHVRDLAPLDLLKLLYCEDRDVAKEAQGVIESQASQIHYLPALVEILEDRRHPMRRSAQWCVLDLFEGLPSFCRTEADQVAAIEAMVRLMWDAEDDFARAVYKAGVVLGGHLPSPYGGPALLRTLDAPSRIGRRSAIHGLFHVVEWVPETRDTVIDRLKQRAETDPEPKLRDFARLMARDIANGDPDHITEPVFENEIEPERLDDRTHDVGGGALVHIV